MAAAAAYECNLASDRIALINPPDPVFGLRLPGRTSTSAWSPR